jgi:ABC-type antimicrobial peptide transport system permease subunit
MDRIVDFMNSQLVVSYFRNFVREPLYSSINIFGLTVGLSCCVFTFLWVLDEIDFNRDQPDRDRVFALLQHAVYPEGDITTYSASPAPMAPALKDKLQEVEASIRTSWPERNLFAAEKISILQEGIFADPSLFGLFTIPIVQGNGSNPLPDHHSIAISKKMATEFFGTTNAVGNSLLFKGKSQLRVSAVFDNLPRHSTLYFDYVIPYDLAVMEYEERMEWTDFNCYIYLKLRNPVDKASVEEKIRTMMTGSTPSLPLSSDGIKLDFFLHPMSDWRLRNHFENGVQTGGRIIYVYSFAIAGLIVLSLACINFMNLSTARAARRSKEIGIRKVVGASKASLMRLFLTESIISTVFALGASLMVVHFGLPLFNTLTGKRLFIDYADPVIIGSLALITILTGLAAGSYPAFYLSSFNPASVIRGTLFSSLKGVGLRKTLVVVQFSVSLALMACSIVVSRQMDFIRTKELGYDRSNIIYFNPQTKLSQNYQTFRTELLRDPSIVMSCQGDTHPMNVFNNDYAVWEGISEDDPVTVQTSVCDYDYLATMGFQLKSGRLFSRELASDSNAFIINEAMVELMGFSDPIGKKLKVYTLTGHVVGIIKDFNNNSLHNPIDPVVFLLNPGSDREPMTVFIRYQPGKLDEAIAHLQTVYKKFEDAYPLELEFLDTTFERIYENDTIMAKLSIWYAGIAISISCLGLFGLALFTTERRTKEIGIRKVLGASVHRIVIMICNDFFGPVLLAMMIGVVPGYLLADQFLSQYAFHTALSVWIFVWASVALAIIALSAIVFQSVKASVQNPVDTLRMN